MVARHAVAGVLAHAPALAALPNPTVNSYKRFGPDTLAPWLVDWAWTTAASSSRSATSASNRARTGPTGPGSGSADSG